MIEAVFESPAEVDKLANFAVEGIQNARNRVLYIAFLFTNHKIWGALKRKVLEGIEVTVFATPITSYPSSLFQGYFGSRKKVDINASLHILAQDAIPSEYEVKKIWKLF